MKGKHKHMQGTAPSFKITAAVVKIDFVIFRYFLLLLFLQVRIQSVHSSSEREQCRGRVRQIERWRVREVHLVKVVLIYP